MATPAPTEDGPRFTASRSGFTFQVYANRIEVQERATFGPPKRTTVLLRNVASVERAGITGKLRVVTNDGHRYEWLIGVTADAARDAIVSAL